MLTDGVVVEPEMLGQFDHVDRPPRIGDVAEQLVSCRITERTGLSLQHAHASTVGPFDGGVGPVGLLAPERLVVDRAAVGEVDQLGDRQAPRTRAPAEFDVLGELLGERVAGCS